MAYSSLHRKRERGMEELELVQTTHIMSVRLAEALRERFPAARVIRPFDSCAIVSDTVGSGICTDGVAVALGIQSPSIRPLAVQRFDVLQVEQQENAQMPAVCTFPNPHTPVEALLSP